MNIFICLFLLLSGNNLFAQCPPISGLFITSVKSDGVSFKWNSVPPAGTTYQYTVLSATDPPGTPTATTDTFATVSGLNAATQYTISVTYTCIIDPGPTTITFTTPLLPCLILQPAITTPGGITAFCPGGNIVIGSNSNILVANQWYQDDVAIPGANAVNFTATVPGKYTLAVSDLLSTGCVNFSNEIIISNSPVPPTPTITAGGPLTFCDNSSLVLTSSSATGNQWFKDGNPVTGEVNQTFTATTAGSYTVQVTNISGCTATSVATVLITNATPAKPTITPAGPLAFCSNDNVILTSSSAAGNQWFLGTTPITDSINKTYMATVAGSYKVQVTSPEGCSTTSDPVVLTTNAAPAKPTITGLTTFCSNDSVVLTSSSTTGNQWFQGPTPITDSVNQTFTAKVAGSYTVHVTNPAGCTAVSDPIVLTTNAAPAKPSITPAGPLAFCSNDILVLTSSTATSYQWYQGTTAITDSVNKTFTATIAGSYKVQVTNPAGCTSLSDAVVLTTNAAPAKPTITGLATFCSNDSVVLTSSSANGNQWYQGTNLITDSVNKTFTAKAAGSYSVHVTNPAGCTAVSDPFVLTTNVAPPTPTINPAGPLAFCSNDSVVLTSSSTSGNQWFKGTTLITDSVNKTFTATTSGNYSVRVTNGGCSATSNPTVLTVNPAPPKPTVTAGGPTTFCSNDSVKLTSSAPSGNQWINGINDIQDSISKTLIVKTQGAYKVRVTVGGCKSVSDAVNITVINLQAPPTVTADGPLTFCSGDSVVFSSSSASGNQWLKGSVNILGATNQTFAAKLSGSYTVQITGPGGCTVNSIAQVVTVNPLPPKPTVTAGGPVTFCSNDSVKLTSSASNNNQWIVDGAFIQDSVSKTIIVKSSGAYKVLVTGAGGCQSVSDSIKVTVINLQTPPTVSANGPLTFCNGDSVVFSSTSPTGNQWLKDGVNIAGATNQTFTAKLSGTYTVQLSSGGGCNVTSNPQVVTVNPVPPKPTITAGGPVTFCSNDSVKLTSSANTGNQWIVDGAFIQDSVSKTLIVKSSGAYKVLVTGVGGCQSASDSIKVTVINLQTPPTVSADGPLTFCNGDSVVFSSTSATGNQWLKDGVNIVGATNQTFTAKLPGTYTVQLSSGGGCNVVSAPKLVTVNPVPPKPTITAAGPVTFCSNDSVKLTSSANTGNQWIVDGAFIQDSISKTLIVKSSGAYKVLVTGAGGCQSASDSIKVTVINLQTPPIVSASGPLTFCNGDSVVFSSTSATGNQWLKDGVNIVGATNQTFTARLSGTYTVQLSSGGGCNITSAPQVVLVNPVPPKPTIIASGPLTFCSNDSLRLTSSSAAGNQWLKDGVNILDSIAATLTVKTSGAYRVRVIGAGGCVAISDSTKVTVINLQTPPVVSASGPLTFCGGDSVVFSSTSATGNQWLKDGVNIAGATNQTYSAKIAGSYTVQLTSGAGCAVTSAAQVVNVNAQPAKPVITPNGPPTFCSNDSLKLTSSSPNGNQWLKDGNNIQDSVSTTLMVKSSGVYRVRVTAAGGCQAVSDSVKATVINLQTPPVITADGPLTFCDGDSVVFSSTTTTGNQWFRNGIIINGATHQTYSATLSGNYNVQLSSGGGCTVNSAPQAVTVNPTPPKPIITASGPLTFCSNDSVRLSSSSPTGNQWLKNGINIQDSVSTTLLVRNSGAYQVKVGVPGGCQSISDSTKINVINLLTPPVITPDGPLTFCDGDSVVLSSTSATGNQWFKDGIVIAGANTQNFSAKISGGYSVQLSSGGGCTVTSAPMMVTVNIQPVKPVISANGPSTFCSGDSVTLSSSTALGNQWQKDGVNIQDSIAASLVVKTSGSYTVFVIAAGGCQAVSNPLVVSEINISTPPVITPAGPVMVCSGDSVVLSSSSSSGNQWFKDGALIPGAFRQTYEARIPGNYTVQVSSQAGCNATSTAVTVNAGITPPVPVITVDDTLVDCGYAKALYSSSVNGNQWLKNGVPVTGEVQNYYIVTTPGSYSVQVTSVSGCFSVSATRTILIIANPNTPVVTSNDPLSFCAGGSAVLHSSTATNYQWYKDGAPIAGATSQDYTATESGAFTVHVILGVCNFGSQPANVTVINNQTPATITPAGPLNLCNGSTIVLSSSSGNGNQWYKDGVAITGATDATYSAATAGSYTVKITVGTCNSMFSIPVVVNSSDNPAPPTITAGGPLSFCNGGSVLLSSSSATSYQWFKDGTAIPNATTSTYSATDAGSYTVTTKNASSCQAASDAVIVSLTNSTPPPVIAAVGPGPGCGAGETVLISSADLGNQWLKDGVAIPGAVQKTYSTNVGGNYSVALDYGSTCFSESQVVPVVGTTSINLKASITTNNGVLYSDSATGNQWYLNDTLIPGAIDNSYIPQVSGKYTLRITNSSGCSSTFSDPYFAKIENFSDPNVLIFPNPVTDYIFVVNYAIHPVTARVFDIQGRQVLIFKNLTGTSKLNLSILTGGPYVVQVIDEVTGSRTKSLILKYQ